MVKISPLIPDTKMGETTLRSIYVMSECGVFGEITVGEGKNKKPTPMELGFNRP